VGRITRRPYDASAGETGFPTEGIDMKRFAIIVTTLAAVLALSATAALAGNAHFVGTPKAGTSGSTVTASGKVAGLGDESQIHVVVAAQAACVNRGQKLPAGREQADLQLRRRLPRSERQGELQLVGHADVPAQVLTADDRRLGPRIHHGLR